MRHLYGFLHKLNSNLSLDKTLMLKKANRYYLLEKTIKKLATGDFFYAGTYLGKIKGQTFFPSFPLLAMMTKQKANKTKVDAKTEWLFICGRDIFKQGITEITGSKRKGTHTLILNQNGECLGFGKILRDPKEEKSRRQPTIKNIADIGDFLRREKRPPRHR
jgi:ribosome biogenesis protein Nip4